MKALLSLLIGLADTEMPAHHKSLTELKYAGRVDRGITLYT